MSPTAEKLLEQALSLDEEERVSIAGALIESLETRIAPYAEEAARGFLLASRKPFRP